MLEININIGWLVALLGNESLEQQMNPIRIHFGDVQAIAGC